MLGIIVCTHATLAAGLRDAVEMIAGKQEDFEVLTFAEGEDMLALSARIKECAQPFEQRHQPYVVLVDLFGATPFNASAAALAAFDTCIMTGVNLPLLLEFVTQRNSTDSYDELCAKAMASAQGNMRIVKLREMFQTE